MKWILLVLMFLPMSVSADDKKCEIDGIWYILNPDSLTAEVTFGDEKYSGAVSIPATINVVDGDMNKIFAVTQIGEKAFKDCKELTSVGLPKEFESVGQ